MAELLDSKLILEDFIYKLNSLSSINELLLACKNTFKEHFNFTDAYIIVEKNDIFTIISQNEKEYNFSRNDSFANQLINSSDCFIIESNSINNNDIKNIFLKNDILLAKLLSANKKLGYIAFTINSPVDLNTIDIKNLLSFISIKFENLLLNEMYNSINDSKNLKIINQVIKKAISTIHISELLEFITEYLYRHADFDKVFIVTNKDKSDDFVGYIYNNAGLKTLNIENIQYISNINNYRELTEALVKEPSILNIVEKNSFMAFALIIRGKTVGFIGVDNCNSKKQLTENDIYLLQSIATQISISVDNSILYEDMQLNAIGFKNLFEVASSFNLIIDYEQAAKVVVEKVCSTLSVSGGYLISFEIDSYSRVIATREDENPYINSEIELTDRMKYAISSKNIVFYDNLRYKEECFDLASGLIIPLYIKNRLTGLLCIGEKNEHRHFTDHDLKLIETISNQAVVTLENAQLYNKLEDMVVERTVELIDSNKALQIQKDKLEVYSQRLKTIIASIPDGILVVNKEGNVIAVNRAFKDIFNFVNPDFNLESVNELSLKNLISLLDSDEKNRKSLCELVETVLNPEMIENQDQQTNGLINYDLTFEKEQAKYYKVIIAPFVYDKNNEINNDNKNQVIVFHDVTKEKEIDKLKSDFIAVVSHELKTPVSAMMGFATLIEDGLAGETTPQQEEYLYKIQMQGERLIRLINDLLDFSKLEAGQMPLYLQLLDAEEVVNEVVETLRPLADEKSLTLTSNVLPDLPPIHVDPDKLKQILINLISNAIKFTPETTGLIEVKVIYIDENKELLFSVQDNGIGIPEKDKPRLFDRFYQVDNTSTRKYGGTGLGLAIVKKLVELNNGQLWVESKTGYGSTFYFTVPLPEKQEE